MEAEGGGSVASVARMKINAKVMWKIKKPPIYSGGTYLPSSLAAICFALSLMSLARRELGKVCSSNGAHL